MSSGSESDEEYVPEEPEKVSEEESADDETDLQFEKEQEQRNKKRKSVQQRKGKKKIKTTNGTQNKEQSDDERITTEEIVKPEEDKKREDDLWAKFLEGTDTQPKSSAEKTTNAVQSPNTSFNTNKNATCKKSDKDENKERERRIFEFAGETIVVEDNVIKEKIKSSESPASGGKEVGPSRSRAGLSDVLGQLNKKNKISTLEKSKLDWSTYKQKEGIEDEIQSHNKGKEGYLDRQDFLQRADVRQYEIERDLRLKRRSNR